jgi:hypothetical protein
MRVRHALVAVVVAVTGLMPTRPISGQAIRGRVVDAVGHPIYDALVELRSPAGLVVRTSLSTPSGVFSAMAPSPGPYMYRVLAIGFQPLPLRRINLPATGLDLGDIRMQPTAMRLADLVAVAHGRFCGAKQSEGALFARVLDAAHAALDIMEATVGSGAVNFTVARIHTRTTYGSYNNYVVADTTVQPLSRWPIESINPDTLRVVGFGRTLEPGNEATREYYGPDERVLFAGWFLDTHCFSVTKPKKHASADTLHLRFVPAHKSKQIDVEGELSLDAHNLALLAFSFTFTNLPNWMPAGFAGGDMQFSRLASGLWIAHNWEIWAPITGVSYDRHLSVAGEVETYGWVVKTFAGDSTSAAAPR